jgi:LacI family transcriptional regulator
VLTTRSAGFTIRSANKTNGETQLKTEGAVTLSDVAARAGVSIKTVSRVVNREENVSRETRERVEAVLAELDYRPNIFARSLAGSRSYLLSLLFDNPSPSYVLELQLGALRQCRPAGYHLIVEEMDSTSGDFDQQVARLLQGSLADGFILTPPLSDNVEVLGALHERGLPCVRITPYLSGASGSSIQTDDAAAAADMTRHLLGLGHRHIGFIKGHAAHGASHLRTEGFFAAMRTHGLEPEPDLVVEGDFSSRSGVEAAERLLSRPERPTAIFASNDDMALGAMIVASRLGLNIPEDLSICGFDDSRTATLTWPQLTTVRQPVADMSGAAAELLIAQKGAPERLLFDLEVVVRGSTGPARG